jgi:hypothetical protein
VVLDKKTFPNHLNSYFVLHVFFCFFYLANEECYTFSQLMVGLVYSILFVSYIVGLVTSRMKGTNIDQYTENLWEQVLYDLRFRYSTKGFHWEEALMLEKILILAGILFLKQFLVIQGLALSAVCVWVKLFTIFMNLFCDHIPNMFFNISVVKTIYSKSIEVGFSLLGGLPKYINLLLARRGTLETH